MTTYVSPGEEIKSEQINNLFKLTQPIKVSVSNDSIEVMTRYNQSYYMEFSITKLSANKTYQLGSIYLLPVDDLLNKKRVYEQYTDMVSPWYELRAINNIDGDKNGDGIYTGGWHGYDNANSGTPTARTQDIYIYADGAKLTLSEPYVGYCNELKVTVVNFIQGCNVLKKDGTGREILKETVVYTFSKLDIHVEVFAEALEDLTIKKYSFLQFQRAYNYEKRFLVIGDIPNQKWMTQYDLDVIGSLSKDNIVSTMFFEGTSHGSKVSVDTTYGIGSLQSNSPKTCWYHKSYGKAYFNLIDCQGDSLFSLQKGNIITARGCYSFYSK